MGRIARLFTVKDIRERVARSIIIGAFFGLTIGYLTQEVSYFRVRENKRYTIGSMQYESMTDQGKGKFSKSTKYNELFIILGFLMGTGLGYVIHKEQGVLDQKMYKWN
ncbi:hypothetical protein [Dokdonia sp. Asnod2-E02]|uniref:hypothetical protein n=1 Tax=Dokdonia sp. Asnod2-E02 TaxID=3160574 RepID=UPI00386DD29E